MKTLQFRKKRIVIQLVQAGVAWTLLGIAAAAVTMSHPDAGVRSTNQAPGPSAEAIERAVVEAEAQARVAETRRVD